MSLGHLPLLNGLRPSPALRIGAGLLAVVALTGLVVPLFSPYAPDQLIPNARLLPPSADHLFGTDALGRDLLTRIAFGTHLAARLTLLSVSVSLGAGLVLGSLAGFYGGWTDQAIARTMDGWLALPGVLVAIVVVARLGPSFDNLILALGLMGVPAFFRVVRNTTLSARRATFVEAAVALGASDARLMWRHVFPATVSPVIVLTTLRLGTALLTGSSLSFIGLGAQPPLPEWGALLATGRNYLDTAWWLALFPGLAVTITVVGLNLLGDGLRDLFDPHQERPAGRADDLAVEPAGRTLTRSPRLEPVPSLADVTADLYPRRPAARAEVGEGRLLLSEKVERLRRSSPDAEA